MSKEITENPHTNNDIQGLSRAIEKSPEDPLLYFERGWAKQQCKDMEGCLADWNHALSLNPEYTEVIEAKALLSFLDGDFDSAEKSINRALEIDSTLKEKLLHLQGLIQKEREAPGETPFSRRIYEVTALEAVKANPRRDFLKQVAVLGAASAAAATFVGCTPASLMGEETDVGWGKIIDLKRCVGCKACSVACKAENHTPPGIAYHVVMESETGIYPYSKREFLPMPCMQCKNSTCVPICPVKATYERPDGVTVVDYDKCIGCRYCIATCPYGSRSFDYGHYYSHDQSNPWEMMPSPEYGQYRERKNKKSPIGNVRKCTSCLHRIYNGIPPACAATCMGNAIHFGDLNNPEAKCMVHGVNLQELLARRHYRILKEETGNGPRVYYLT